MKLCRQNALRAAPRTVILAVVILEMHHSACLLQAFVCSVTKAQRGSDFDPVTEQLELRFTTKMIACCSAEAQHEVGQTEFTLFLVSGYLFVASSPNAQLRVE